MYFLHRGTRTAAGSMWSKLAICEQVESLRDYFSARQRIVVPHVRDSHRDCAHVTQIQKVREHGHRPLFREWPQ
jgi:hypothetical protein